MYKVAVIVPFFKSVESNVEQSIVDEFSAMSESTLKNIELIIVDDCSSVPLKIDIKNKFLSLKLYRIDTDIEWNVGGAKNLGAQCTNCEKLLFFDADHIVNEDNLNRVIDYDLFDHEHLVFITDKKGSPGVFCTSRKRFFELNGFDENFSGHYGYEDINYRKRHEINAGGGFFTEIEEAVTVRESYHHHTLERNSERNGKIVNNLNHSGKFINFEWHKVNLE